MLPAIHKTGQYKHQDSKMLIDAYDKIKVVYVGNIGEHDGVHMVKFGSSDDIKERHAQHKREIKNFQLERVVPCFNNREVESAFKKHPQIRARQRAKTIHGKQQVELLALAPDFTMKDIDGIFHRIIADNPPVLLDHIRKRLQDTNAEEDKEVKVRKLELDHQLAMKKLEVDLEIKRMEHQQEMARMQMGQANSGDGNTVSENAATSQDEGVRVEDNIQEASAMSTVEAIVTTENES